jgi:hypothetical protein
LQKIIARLSNLLRDAFFAVAQKLLHGLIQPVSAFLPFASLPRRFQYALRGQPLNLARRHANDFR